MNQKEQVRNVLALFFLTNGLQHVIMTVQIIQMIQKGLGI